MKTAEDWIDPLDDVCLSSVETRKVIEQIQLDAMKDGMQRAGALYPTMIYDEVQTGERVYDIACKNITTQLEKAIFTAAEQLTDKDLV